LCAETHRLCLDVLGAVKVILIGLKCVIVIAGHPKVFCTFEPGRATLENGLGLVLKLSVA
jgi:hypothetical protein